jgi:ribosomal protein S18 acetylase RimI-like enzyme
MGFWKNLFSDSDTLSAPTLATAETPVAQGLRLPKPSTAKTTQPQICFSQDREIDLYELERLCDAVGWSRRPLRKVRKAIEHSFLVISMWELKGDKSRLIGFSRATSDHAFNATIWDVVVHPDFQGRGLGKALMKQIIKELRRADISNITLFADPHVIDFYRDLGFSPDPEGIKGMFWYPNSR